MKLVEQAAHLSEVSEPAVTPGQGPAVPSVLAGRYRLEREIGRGGMGRVFVGQDLKLGREVAIKLMALEQASLERRQRFEQEARAIARLSHPSVVALFDAGIEGDQPWLVSELLEGESLRARIQRSSLPLADALDLARQIAEGLLAAHARGIIHRDLKPDNVFVTKQGRAVLLDFGIARVLAPETETLDEGDDRAPHTQTGGVLGTVGYMSPEQVRGTPASASADLFAFGALLYEMVSGRRAFRRATPVETASCILNEEPEPLDRELPNGLVRLVADCLRKDPSARVQDAGEVVRRLRALQEGAPSRRFGGGLAALLAAGLVAAALGSAFFLRSRARDLQTGGPAVGASLERRDRPLPPEVAQREYQRGVEVARAGDLEAALQRFQAAITRDETFAEAHFRFGVAAMNAQQHGLAEDELRKALRFGSGLPAPEIALIEGSLAFEHGHFAEAGEKYRHALDERPDDAFGWQQLAELQIVAAPFLGRSPVEAAEALRRALALDPQLRPALERLLDLAQVEGDGRTARALATRLVGMPIPDKGRTWAARLLGIAPEARPALLPELKAAQLELHDCQEVVRRLLWDGDYSQARGVAQLMAAAADKADRAQGQLSLALIDLAAGRPAAARAHLASSLAEDREYSILYYSAFLDTAEFLPVPLDRLSAQRSAVLQLDPARIPYVGLARLWVAGALAARSGDLAAANAAFAELSQGQQFEGSSLRADFAKTLGARVAARAGRAAESLAGLESLKLEIPGKYAAISARLPEQLLRAELLAQAGRRVEALRWTQALSVDNAFEPIFVVPALLRAASIADSGGEAALAAAARARANLRWASAEPELHAMLAH